MAKDRILVFIPAYNCEKQITRVLAQLEGKVSEYIDEVIIVNNLSTDNTVEAAKEYLSAHPSIPCRIINNNSNYNLGGSHKTAFNYALKNGFDHIIVLHGDDQADIRDLLPVLEKRIYRKYDCILGGRFEKGSRLQGYSVKRILGNKVFNVIYTIAANRSIRDMGSGLNMYKTGIFRSKYYIGLSDAIYFNAEMLLFSAYYGHRMRFYPISWREEDQVSNAKLFSLSWNLLKLALKYFFKREEFIASYKKPDIYTGSIVYDNMKKEDIVNG